MLMKKTMIAAAAAATLVFGAIAFLGQANETAYGISILLMMISLTVTVFGSVHRSYWGKEEEPEMNRDAARAIRQYAGEDTFKDAA